MPSTPRHRRSAAARPRTVVAVIAASLTLHAAALYGADRSELLRSEPRDPMSFANSARASATPTAPPAPPSCEANAMLAAAARLALCTTPLHDRRSCTRATIDRLSLGVTVCNALAMSSEIDLMSPAQVEAIAAEPLLEIEQPAPGPEPEPKPIELIAAVPAPTPPPPPPPPESGQVVEITRPKVEKAPEDTRLVSEYDSAVERETVAPGAAEKMVERPERADLRAVENPREAAISEQPKTIAEKPTDNPDGPQGAGALAMRKPGESKPAKTARDKQTAGALTGKDEKPTGAGLDVARGTADTTRDAQQASAGETGENGAGGGRPLIPNLVPSKDILERAVGGGSGDYLPDVAKGDKTALNTRQWRYASFFNRIKLRVRQHWHPAQVFARRDPNGNVYGTKNRLTRVTVTLDRKGKLRAIVISKKSGVDVLDQEAVSAFRLAQPFPNPPRGLIDPRTGLIVFQFGFHFDVRRRAAWKIYRHR